MHRKQKDRTLTKILVLIVLVGGLGYGVTQFGRSLYSRHFGVKAEESVQQKLAEAQTHLEQGSFDKARELLEPLAAKSAGQAGAMDALMLLARTEREAGNLDAAVTLLERAYKEFPDSPEHTQAAVEYARGLEQAGKAEQALAVFEEVSAIAPPEMRAAALVGLAVEQERKGDLLGARERLREAFRDATPDSETWNEALDALGRVNVALIFSPGATPESKVHIIQKGDNITNIGNNLNTTQGLLMRANNIDERTNLSIGMQVKYTPKDFRIVIERSKCRLFLVDKDGVFKRYAVGLGKPGHETTLGSYRLGNKTKDPVWHKPGEGPIPANDPRNELGTRWMPLVPDQEGLPRDLGIHGTIAPETVGQFSSHGCARLLPAEIEELYDLVVRSTPVDIVEHIDWSTWDGFQAQPSALAQDPKPLSESRE